MSAHKLGLPALLLMAGLPVGTADAANDKSVMLVLDASGSMKSALPDGTSRMDAAKSAVVQLVATLPADTKLAFRAYGHQSPQQQKNCKDSALLAPFDSVEKNRATVIGKAMSLQPQGFTPITYSLTLAGQEMLQQEAASHVVVLVSDGKETCEADPCAAAKAMADADAKLVVHTIGAGVDQPTRNQLECIAAAARGSYFDANSSVELATVVGQAAQTEAVATPEVKVAQKTAISQKSASTDQKAPTQIETGEIVKGRLGDGNSGIQHYWKLKAPAGRYRVVLDAKIANDDHGVIQTRVHAMAPGGGEPSRIIATNEADFRTRAAVWIDSTGEDLILRVDNELRIVDYWLGIFPEAAQIPAPYFVRTPTVQPLELGKTAAAALDPKPGSPAGAWYSIALKPSDYKITAEFKRKDGRNTNVQAYIDLFGEIGETPGTMESRICAVNEVATGGTCSVKLVVAREGQVMFRLSPNGDNSYKTTFKVEPTEADASGSSVPCGGRGLVAAQGCAAASDRVGHGDCRTAQRRAAIPLIPGGCYFLETRKIVPLPSSLTSSAPSVVTATPAGRPQTVSLSSRKPVMKSWYSPVGLPSFMRTGSPYIRSGRAGYVSREAPQMHRRNILPGMPRHHRTPRSVRRSAPGSALLAAAPRSLGQDACPSERGPGGALDWDEPHAGARRRLGR
jgi:hypothetical protein